MLSRCRLHVALTCLLVVSAAPRVLGAKHSEYKSIEVTRFEVQEGLDLPAKFKITLATDLKLQLSRIGGIEVVSEGQEPKSDGPRLRLTGTINEFKGGSRAVRYLIPVIAGKTKIGARIQVLDRESGEVLLETDVDGKVLIGPFGGDTMGASNGLAKEAAKKIRGRFF